MFEIKIILKPVVNNQVFAKHEIEIDKICKEILDCDNNNNKILAGNGVHVLIVNILLRITMHFLKK